MSEINPQIKEKLIHLRESKSPELYPLVLAVHNAGWSFQSIGDVLGVTRSAVNQWHKLALKKGIEPMDITVNKPEVVITGTARKIRPDIPSADRQHLLEVATLARKNRRWSDSDSKERLAAQELEQLIKYHILERGVSVSRFARRAGVTNRAISQRLERIGVQ